VLFNEPKLLKSKSRPRNYRRTAVSVLFNEPKLLKFSNGEEERPELNGFSALQRAEIAEIVRAVAGRA